jgi:hypothetical protein
MLNPRMKWSIAMLLAFQMIVPAPILAAAVGQFTSVVGDVTVTRAGVVSKPVVKSPVQEKDWIVTGPRASAKLVFDDDSTISLEQNSRFEVRDFQVKGNARKGMFALALGRLIADVQRFIGGESYFEVHTPTAIAGVRGTGFVVSVAMIGGQMTTTVTCTAGILSVSAMSATGAILTTTTIVAGQTAVVTAAGITVSATAAGGAAGAATAAGTGSAEAAGAATTAGAAAGAATTAGVTAGTVAVGVAAAAAVITAVTASSGSETPTAQHGTTPHH